MGYHHNIEYRRVNTHFIHRGQAGKNCHKKNGFSKNSCKPLFIGGSKALFSKKLHIDESLGFSSILAGNICSECHS